MVHVSQDSLVDRRASSAAREFLVGETNNSLPATVATARLRTLLCLVFGRDIIA